MNCNVCGHTYSASSLGGPGICSRCDCGITPSGSKYSFEEAHMIAARYKAGQVPYFVTLDAPGLSSEPPTSKVASPPRPSLAEGEE